MAELATFNPVLSKTREEMLKYYKDNQIELPENPYFNEYFDITPQTTGVIEQAVPESYAPRFFNNTYIKTPKSTATAKPVQKQETTVVPEQSYRVIIGAIDSIASRNNNPGNLMYAGQSGAVKGEARGEGNWAKFNTPEEGFKALMDQIDLDKSRNLTLEQFIGKYAPPSENDTVSYISKVAKSLNVDKSIPLKDVGTFNMAKVIARLESSTLIK